MIHAVATWLLVAAFAGAGLVNALGTFAAQDNFVRWGFPRWWCYFTGGLELATAVLIALRPLREVGLILGAAIIAAAVITVVRHRELSHLAPLGVFVVLIVLVQASS